MRSADTNDAVAAQAPNDVPATSEPPTLPPADAEWLTVEEAAALFRCDRKTILLACQRRQLGARRIGRLWRIPRPGVSSTPTGHGPRGGSAR